MSVMKRLATAKMLGTPLKEQWEIEAEQETEDHNVWFLGGIRHELVPSDTTEDAYCVILRPNGKIECNCKQYTIRLRGKGKLCKHGIQVRDRLKS